MASCRACGGEMQAIASCPACEESVQWRCSSCSKETDVSVHSHEGRTFGAKDVLYEKPEPSVAAAA